MMKIKASHVLEGDHEITYDLFPNDKCLSLIIGLLWPLILNMIAGIFSL